LDLVKTFLNLLQGNRSIEKFDASQPLEYRINDTFSVTGVGTVVAGTIMSGINPFFYSLGTVQVGDILLLGPDVNGAFTPTLIKSIQRKRVSVPHAVAGQSVSFALKKIKRSNIKKGMILAR
jgi:GTPase